MSNGGGPCLYSRDTVGVGGINDMPLDIDVCSLGPGLCRSHDMRVGHIALVGYQGTRYDGCRPCRVCARLRRCDGVWVGCVDKVRLDSHVGWLGTGLGCRDGVRVRYVGLMGVQIALYGRSTAYGVCACLHGRNPVRVVYARAVGLSDDYLIAWIIRGDRNCRRNIGFQVDIVAGGGVNRID